MTSKEAIKLIGKPIYTYKTFVVNLQEKLFDYDVYESTVVLVGADRVLDNGTTKNEEDNIHYFDEYNKTWFTDKNQCMLAAQDEIAGTRVITNREWLMTLSDIELSEYLKGCDICDNYELKKKDPYFCTNNQLNCHEGHWEWLTSPCEKVFENKHKE